MTAVTTRPTTHPHRSRVLELHAELVDDYVNTTVAWWHAERAGKLELAEGHRAVAEDKLEQLATRTGFTAAQIRGHLHQRVVAQARPHKSLIYRLTHL